MVTLVVCRLAIEDFVAEAESAICGLMIEEVVSKGPYLRANPCYMHSIARGGGVGRIGEVEYVKPGALVCLRADQWWRRPRAARGGRLRVRGSTMEITYGHGRRFA